MQNGRKEEEGKPRQKEKKKDLMCLVCIYTMHMFPSDNKWCRLYDHSVVVAEKGSAKCPFPRSSQRLGMEVLSR